MRGYGLEIRFWNRDVRQLTVYAELLLQREKLVESPDIMILYPFVGTGLFQSHKQLHGIALGFTSHL